MRQADENRGEWEAEQRRADHRVGEVSRENFQEQRVSHGLPHHKRTQGQEKVKKQQRGGHHLVALQAEDSADVLDHGCALAAPPEAEGESKTWDSPPR